MKYSFEEFIVCNEVLRGSLRPLFEKNDKSYFCFKCRRQKFPFVVHGVLENKLVEILVNAEKQKTLGEWL